MVPTNITYFIYERSAEVLKMIYITKTNSVPYCDCFAIEYEW